MNESLDRALPDNPESTYRERIYHHYVNARSQVLAPLTLDGLGPRAAYLRKLVRNHFPTDRDAATVDQVVDIGALIYFAPEAGLSQCRTDRYRSPEQVVAVNRLGIRGVRDGDLMEAISSLPGESQAVVVTFDVIEHFRKDEEIVFVRYGACSDPTADG